jgi:hypothetical protein
MYNPTIFNSQPNTKIKFFDDRSKRHTETEDIEEKEDGGQLLKPSTGESTKHFPL